MLLEIDTAIDDESFEMVTELRLMLVEVLVLLALVELEEYLGIDAAIATYQSVWNQSRASTTACLMIGFRSSIYISLTTEDADCSCNQSDYHIFTADARKSST